MRLTEAITWRPLRAQEPAHEQLCLVILADESSPRVLEFVNDPALGAAFWNDPHRSSREWWNKAAHAFDQWAPAPSAPVAPIVAVAS